MSDSNLDLKPGDTVKIVHKVPRKLAQQWVAQGVWLEYASGGQSWRDVRGQTAMVIGVSRHGVSVTRNIASRPTWVPRELISEVVSRAGS